MPGVIATPHIGASTLQAQEAVADEVARIVTNFVTTGEVSNVCNVTAQSPASHLLIVRHLNRVGVLSHVFSALKDAQINVQETENIVFDGGLACIARIRIDSAADPAVLAADARFGLRRPNRSSHRSRLCLQEPDSTYSHRWSNSKRASTATCSTTC
jgi:D-3-phosphoglycerate dehydrogenase